MIDWRNFGNRVYFGASQRLQAHSSRVQQPRIRLFRSTALRRRQEILRHFFDDGPTSHSLVLQHCAHARRAWWVCDGHRICQENIIHQPSTPRDLRVEWLVSWSCNILVWSLIAEQILFAGVTRDWTKTKNRSKIMHTLYSARIVSRMPWVPRSRWWFIGAELHVPLKSQRRACEEYTLIWNAWENTGELLQSCWKTNTNLWTTVWRLKIAATLTHISTWIRKRMNWRLVWGKFQSTLKWHVSF